MNPQEVRDPETAQRHKEFETQIHSHIAYLRNYALSLTRDTDDAKDLFQNTLLKAYQAWSSYKQGTNLRAWLSRIMRNDYINAYRLHKKQGNRIQHDISEIPGEYLYERSLEHVDEETEISEKHLSDEMSEVLASLSDEFRTIIMLADVEMLRYEEIAAVTHIVIGSVRSRLWRARRELRSRFTKYAHTYHPYNTQISS